MYFRRGLGTLSEMHQVIFNKKITKHDLNEYAALMGAID